MQNYLDLLADIKNNGHVKADRTGVGTLSLFGRQLRFNLTDGFPLLTTKRVHFKGVKEELLWFLRGESNLKSLRETGVKIWDNWADDRGELGPVYGVQWRRWDHPEGWIDQISNVVQSLRKQPDSRRHIVSAWNVGDIPEMALPPCHTLFQFYVHDDKLSCHMYQRSGDIFLGVPYDIASYALLTHMIAQVTDLQPWELVISFGDVHLYLNHTTQAELQLTRMPRRLPVLSLNQNLNNIDDFSSLDIALLNYNPHPAISAPVAV